MSLAQIDFTNELICKKCNHSKENHDGFTGCKKEMDDGRLCQCSFFR